MSELPTKDELAKLPLRAIVAYAVRAARRVQPLYELFDDNSDKWNNTLAVDKAISFTENSENGIAVAIAAIRASAATIIGNRGTVVHTRVAVAASAVTRVAVAKSTSSAARAAASVASSAVAAESSSVAASAADFKNLTLIASKDVIDLSESGPLGPLWPEGPPDWWDEKVAKMNETLATAREMERRGEITWDEEEVDSAAGSQELVIEIEIPEGVSDERVQEKVLWLIDNADEYHRACGGEGLEVAEIELFDETQVPERSQP